MSNMDDPEPNLVEATDHLHLREKAATNDTSDDDKLGFTEIKLEQLSRAQDHDSISNNLTDFTPFICGVCNCKFTNFIYFIDHLKCHESVMQILNSDTSKFSNTENVTLYSCLKCHGKFPSINVLEEHILEIECTSDFIINGSARNAYLVSHDTLCHIEELLKNDLIDGYRNDGPMEYQINRFNLQPLKKPWPPGPGHRTIARSRYFSKMISAKRKKASAVRSTGLKNACNTRQTLRKTKSKAEYHSYQMNVSISGDPDKMTALNSIERQTSCSKTFKVPFSDNGIEGELGDTKEAAMDYRSDLDTSDDDVQSDKADIKPKTKRTKEQKGMSNAEECSVTENIIPVANDNTIVDVIVKGCLSKASAMSDNNFKEVVTTKHDGTPGQVKGKHVDGDVTVMASQLNRFECSICSSTFKLKTSLARHMKQHTTEGFDCNVCGKRYYVKSELKVHEQSHLGPQFMCKVCGKAFTTKLGCRRHENKHAGIFVHFCDVCQKGFNYKSDLLDHKALHSEEKLHQCKNCPRMFKFRSSLKRHESGCGVEAQHACDLCGKLFKEKRYMKEHSCQRKGNNRLFKCEICGEVFQHHSTFYRHKKKTGHT